MEGKVRLRGGGADWSVHVHSGVNNRAGSLNPRPARARALGRLDGMPLWCPRRKPHLPRRSKVDQSFENQASQP